MIGYWQYVKAFRRYLQRSTRPIVLGPWHSELGAEILYWQPFCRWLLHEVEPERVTAISRGGPAAFYPAQHYRDLCSAYSLADLRRFTFEASQTPVKGLRTIKQYRVQRWEKAYLAQVQKALGEKPIVIHPAMMHRLFDGYWRLQEPIGAIFRATDWAPPAMPPLLKGMELPEGDFSAVKFYTRATFRLSPDLRRLIERIVTGLLARGPVVVLSDPTLRDDHMDIPIEDREGIIRFASVPDTANIALQIAAIARAKRFVGTYGGVQNVALRYGVPSMGLYTNWGGTMIAHKHLLDSLSLQTGVPFDVLNVAHFGMWSSVYDQLSSRNR